MLMFVSIAAIAQGAFVGAVAIYLITKTRAFLGRAIRTDALVVDALASVSQIFSVYSPVVWNPSGKQFSTTSANVAGS